MKRVMLCLALFAVSLGFLVGNQAIAQSKEVKWDSFRKNLLSNLASSNYGVRESALLLLNQYSRELGLKRDEVDDPIWETFRKNLEKNLASSNYGVRQSAMQLIIHYGDRLKLDRNAVFCLMKTYRNEKDMRYRRMALAALHKTQDEWAMGFLRTSLKFEKDPALKHMIQAIILDYDSRQIGS
jgi:hypothetical protein